MTDPEKYPRTEETDMLDLMTGNLLLHKPDAILITDGYQFDLGTRFTVDVETITGVQFPSADVEMVENITIFDNPDEGEERGIVVSFTHEYGDGEPRFIGYVDHPVLADVQSTGNDHLEQNEQDIMHTISCLASIIPGECEWTQDSYDQNTEMIAQYRKQVEDLSQRGDRIIDRSVDLTPDNSGSTEILIENSSIKTADDGQLEEHTDVRITQEMATNIYKRHSDGGWSIERSAQEDELVNPRDVLDAMWIYLRTCSN